MNRLIRTSRIFNCTRSLFLHSGKAALTLKTHKKALYGVQLLRTRPTAIITPVFAVFSVVLTLSSLFIYLYTPTARVQAATNSTINFQARILSNTGAVVPDGYYNAEFKLYSVVTAGSAVWTETWYDANGVTAGQDNRIQIKNGYLTASLGSLTAFANTIEWDQELWLSMNIGGVTQTATPTWDGEMAPRMKVTAVPYAFRAAEATQLKTINGANVSTLNIAAPTGGNQVFVIPDQGAAGTYNVLTANTANANYIQNQSSTPQTANYYIQSAGSSTVGAVVRGAVSQSAALMRYENSNGDALAVFGANGQLTLGNDTGTPQVGSITFNDNTGSNGFTAVLTSAAALTANVTYRLPVAGAGTYDICTSAGNCLGGGDIIQNGNSYNAPIYIGSNDNFDVNIETNGTSRLVVQNDGDIAFDTNTLFVDAANNRVGILNVAPGNPLSVNTPTTADSLAQLLLATGAAGNKGLVVQGVAGQTANLVEWQDSTGAFLGSISSSGQLNTPRIYLGTGGITNTSTGNNAAIYTNSTGSLISRNIADSNAVLTVRQVNAGSTGNILDLQNSGGTTLSGFNVAGNLFYSNSTFSSVLSSATLTANRSIVLPNEDGTICTTGSVCSSYAPSATNGYVQLAPASAQADATTNSSIYINKTGASGNILQLQNTGFDVLVLSNAGDLTVQNTTVAAGKSLTVTGGNTASRPATPTEGMVYFDTDTKQLLTYANGKWQADRSTATKIVAAYNSSQAVKDSADYVADGTDDQVQINAALTAAAGGKVYLAEGRYTTHRTDSGDATIFIPNDTTLVGAGNGTIIRIGGINATDNLIEATGTNRSGQTVRDLYLDGNYLENVGGSRNGIYLDGVGNGTTSGGGLRAGAQILNVEISNFRSGSGIVLNNSHNNLISGNNILTNKSAGLTSGLTIDGTSSWNIITDNIMHDNTIGIYIASASAQYNTISNNKISNGTSAGVLIFYGQYNSISGNTLYNNGGTTDNNAIVLGEADSTNITGNIITDDSCTASCNPIVISSINSDNTYLADNWFSSTPGTSTIYDAGTGTVFANQPMAENGMQLLNRTLNSTNAFSIQGSNKVNIFNVDSTNGEIEVGSYNSGTNPVAGKLVVANANNANTITLLSTATPSANRTIYLPDEDGTICLQSSANCGFAPSATNGYVQLAPASAQADATTNSSIYINKTGASGNILQLQKAGTDKLVVTNSGNVGVGTSSPAAALDVRGNSTVYNGTGTISSSVTTVTGVGTSFLSEFSPGDVIIAAGQSKVVATITSDTVLSTANGGYFGPELTAGTTFTYAKASQRIINTTNQVGLFIQGAAGQSSPLIDVLDNTGNYLFMVTSSGATTISSTLQVNNGLFKSSNSSAATFTSGDFASGSTQNTTLKSGNSGAGNSGNVIVDAGTATGTAGAINIGTTNASAVNIGRSGASLNIQGNGATSGTNVVALRVAGDTNDRFIIAANGDLKWGSGSAAYDTDLYRSGAGRLATTGSLQINTNLYVNGIIAGAQSTVTTNVAGTIGQIIRGTASQTADLLQLQNSAGNVLSYFNANGDLSVGGANSAASASAFQVQDTGAASLFTVNTLARTGGQAGNVLKVGNSTGTDTDTTLLVLDGATAAPTTNLASLNGALFYNTTTNKVSAVENGAVVEVCTTGVVCSGYAPSATNGYVQLAPASAQADATTNSSIYINKTGASGNILQLQKAGVDVFTVSNIGAALFTNNSDSTSAFNIESSTGGNLLTVDTINSRVGINLGLNNTPTLASTGLEVNGALRLSGSTMDNFTTPQGSTVTTKINIPLFNPGAFNQIMSMGLPNSAVASSRVLSLFDNRGVGNNQPALSVFTPDENNVFGFGTDGSNTTGYLKSTGIDLGIKIGATELATFSTASGIYLKHSVTVEGNLTVGNASTDRLTINAQLQGSSPLIMQGATDNGFATTLELIDPTVNNTITLPNASGTVLLDSTLTTNGDLLYNNGTIVTRLARGNSGDCLTSNGTTLVWLSCAAGTTLQNAYNNSVGGTTPEIKVDGTRGGLDIQDANTSIASSLLTVRGSNGAGLGSSLFDVNSNGRVGINLGASSASADLSFGSGANRTLNVITNTTNAAGYSLTVVAGAAGSGAGAFTGGTLTLQGGAAAGTGNANGGGVLLTGGAGVGTGVKGLVVIDTPTFTTAITQNCGTSCTITQANVDANGAVIINATATGLDVTLPDPTITTAGRIVYVTAANASSDFTLVVNGGGIGNEIAMRQNTTATMIWNGSDWTAAGASSSTTLQAAYDNTLTAAGGAEIVLNNSASANGLTVRNNATTPIIGGIFEAQTSIGSNLFSVNNNATEYASNGGAETEGASSSTFPANTWTAAPAGGTVSRTTTSHDIATGQAAAQVVTTAANHGFANQLNATLTPNLKYAVSFATHQSGTTSFNTLDVVYSRDGTNTSTVTCATNQTVTSSSYSRINCTFTAPSSGITSSNAIFIRQTDATGRTFFVDNLSVTVSSDVNHAADGSADDPGNFATNWTAYGASTVTRNTSILYDTSASTSVATTAAAGDGVRNNLAIAPQASTQYLVTLYGRSTTAFNDLRIRYSRDGGTNFVNCVDYNTQSVSTSSFTRVTCVFETDGTAASNPDLIIDQTAGSARTFYIDALSVALNTNTASNVQIGGGSNGGPTTLFTLDRSASAPIADNNAAYYGSMYYDTTSGRIQCYEADGWGACGSAPDNFVNLNPEYSGAVLNGSGIGTMTADLCANETGVLTVNSGLCSTGQSKNYYRWTSPQANEQTYSIYVSYQLPSTFKGFASDDTVQLTARVDSTTNAAVTYEMFRSEGGSLVKCGTTETAVTTSANAWQTVGINGNEATGCGFTSNSANAFVIFKVNVKAKSNANAYVSTLSFTTTGR